MEEIFANLVGSFAPVMGTIITGLVSWGVIEITKYVRAKTKSEAANDAVAHICHTVETVVTDLNRTMVPAMQEAALDGKISKNDGLELKRLAVNQVKSQLPSAIDKAARLAVNSVDTLISAKIEQAVHKQKG